MKTGKVLRGGVRLAFDGVEAVNGIVEQMYRNISAAPLPFGRAPEGPAPGIAGKVHALVRAINGGLRGASDLALAPLADSLDKQLPPGPHRAAIVAALNGVCGDHLSRTNNPLAIAMSLRALVGEGAIAATSASAELFDSQRRSLELYPRCEGFEDAEFCPGPHLLVLAHGLCMNELEWTAKQHNHGHMLQEAFGYSPVFVHYNSGRHISTNGRELAEQITSLVERWPVPVESISFIGFSMGGLVVRSAMSIASEERLPWLERVEKAVYIGSPHHGSALERGGYWLQRAVAFSPYTAPLAALGKLRSDGITDLRHGNIADVDWQSYDQHQDNADHRVPVPLPEGVAHYAIAASLSAPSSLGLRSDGLVHPDSALGRHPLGARSLSFDADHQRLFYKVDHLGLLSHPGVAEQLKVWLARS